MRDLSISIFTTWTTYGTWLSGDQRGWYKPDIGFCDPDMYLRDESVIRMNESAITLDEAQRVTVERTITDHCKIRGWELHAVNCRSNHIHVLLTVVNDCPKELPREQFKAWSTRKLRLTNPARRKWWTEGGWDQYVDDDESFKRVIEYIRNQ